MTRKPSTNTSTEVPQDAILALAGKLLECALAHIASGKPVTQEDVAIVNRARRALNPLRKHHGTK